MYGITIILRNENDVSVKSRGHYLNVCINLYIFTKNKRDEEFLKSQGGHGPLVLLPPSLRVHLPHATHNLTLTSN